LSVSPSLGAVLSLYGVHMLAWYSSRFALAPDKASLLDYLSELVDAFGNRGAAARLGVSGVTVYAWREGRGLSSGSSRRLIWLTWALCLHPDRLKTDFDLVTWGRFRK
jgi:hypothetical protein